MHKHNRFLTTLIASIVIILLTSCATPTSQQQANTAPTPPPRPTYAKRIISILNQQGKSTTITAEIAASPEEHSYGLMYQTSLPENQGMMFLFNYPFRYAFWMKNTLIPLEMIFADKDKKIVDIIHAAPCKQDPCPNYEPKKEGMFVLEVNEGFSNKNSISIGDEVVFGENL
ncbi:MAG: DUF192 domain-containing protein [bacterium]